MKIATLTQSYRTITMWHANHSHHLGYFNNVFNSALTVLVTSTPRGEYHLSDTNGFLEHHIHQEEEDIITKHPEIALVGLKL